MTTLHPGCCGCHPMLASSRQSSPSLLSIHPGFTQNFGYDAKSRLPSAYPSADNESFQCGANGNRVARAGYSQRHHQPAGPCRRHDLLLNPEGQHLRKTGVAGATYFAPGPGGESIFRAGDFSVARDSRRARRVGSAPVATVDCGGCETRRRKRRDSTSTCAGSVRRRRRPVLARRR